MLRGLFKRDDIDIGPAPALSPIQSPPHSPARSPKRRAKPVRIARLYPESRIEPDRQAEILLGQIQEFVDDGAYVPMRDLERYYADLCKERRWEQCHWSVFGAALSRRTHKRLMKRRGKRFMAYKIPRTCV